MFIFNSKKMYRLIFSLVIVLFSFRLAYGEETQKIFVTEVYSYYDKHYYEMLYSDFFPESKRYGGCNDEIGTLYEIQNGELIRKKVINIEKTTENDRRRRFVTSDGILMLTKQLFVSENNFIVQILGYKIDTGEISKSKLLNYLIGPNEKTDRTKLLNFFDNSGKTMSGFLIDQNSISGCSRIGLDTDNCVEKVEFKKIKVGYFWPESLSISPDSSKYISGYYTVNPLTSEITTLITCYRAYDWKHLWTKKVRGRCIINRDNSSNIYWSPDGKSILFAQSEESADEKTISVFNLNIANQSVTNVFSKKDKNTYFWALHKGIVQDLANYSFR